MDVYLVRHAIAVPREWPGVLSDASRELTAEGIKKMRRIARGLRRLGCCPAAVWTSPYVRARQTAEILSEYLDQNPPVHVVTALEPSGHFESLIDRLRTESHLTAVALVGHEPYLGTLTSFLIGGPRNLDIGYKKGGVGCVGIESWESPIRGTLCWLMTPRQLTSLR